MATKRRKDQKYTLKNIQVLKRIKRAMRVASPLLSSWPMRTLHARELFALHMYFTLLFFSFCYFLLRVSFVCVRNWIVSAY